MKIRIAPLLVALSLVISAAILIARLSIRVAPAAPTSAAPFTHLAKQASTAVLPAQSADSTASITAPRPEPIPAFQQWLRDYQLASPEHRRALEPRGVQLATERRSELHQLIAKDPQRAIKVAVPMAQRRFLPAAIQPLLERRINARGELAFVAATPRPGRKLARIEWHEARLGEETLEAFVYGRRSQVLTQSDISIQGIALDGRMAVLDAPTEIISRSDLAPDVKLEQPIAMEHTSDEPVPEQTPVVSYAGRYQPMCCARHAVAFAGQVSEFASEAAPGPVTVSTGDHNVLVIVTDFSDAPGRPTDTSTTPATSITTAYATARIGTEVRAFFNQASYGKLDISSVTVTPTPLRMPGTLASYASTGNTAKLKADALAAAAGFNPSSYQHVICVFADTSFVAGNQWDWAGFADLGGSFVWINSYLDLAIVSHELGHNLGMPHANQWLVTGTNPVDTAGSSLEYGDPFDIMGGGPGETPTQPAHPNPWFLQRLGWLPNAAIQTITTSGTYRVYRYDHQSADLASTLALRFARDGQRDYWLSYRRKYAGHPTLGDGSAGASVMWGYAGIEKSNLIDIDGPNDGDATNASLNVGNTFTDSAAGVTMTVQAAGGSGTAEYLDIAIAFQPRIVFDAPAISVEEIAGSLALRVRRTGNSSGAVTANFATVNGTALAGSDYTATSGTLSWATGDSADKTITIPITNDAIVDSGETFRLQLSSVVGATTPDGNSVTITILESGGRDASYVAAFLPSAVRDFAIAPDSSATIGGVFGATSGITSAGISRLTASGLLDVAFDAGAGVNSPPEVRCIVRQPDGSVLIGGAFSTLRGVGANRIARLRGDGTLDASFSLGGAGPNNTVLAIAVQPDGKILVGGTFTTWHGAARPGLVRLNSDGSLDTSFVSFDGPVDPVGVNPIQVSGIALQPIATAPHFRVIAVGMFLRPATSGGFHSGIVAVNAITGALDTTFDSIFGAHASGVVNSLRSISTVLVQPDGKILVGGQFTGFGGVAAGHIARLNANGTNDAAFITASGVGANGIDITSITQQPDGKLVVAGNFTTVAGQAQSGVARFNSTGSFDTAFRPSITFSANLVAAYKVGLQPDGKLLAAFNGAGDESGSGQSNVVRRYFASKALSRFRVIDTAVTVAEGGSATISVAREGSSLGAVSVNFATIASTATGGSDYTTSTGTLAWADGDSAPKTISVPTTLDSDTAEGTETFAVQLGTPLGGALLDNANTSAVTILGVDPATLPNISITGGGSANEASGDITFTVQSSLAATSAITVPFTLTGTAIAGTDYTVSPASSVTFAIGETSKTITITPKQDAILESAETITITLGAINGAALLGTPITSAGMITDDEALPTISFAPPTQLIVPLGVSTTLSVTRTGNPLPTITKWLRGITLVSAVNSTEFNIASPKLTDAGTYKVTALSPLAPAVTTVTGLDLGVIDKTPKTSTLPVGANAVFTVSASTNILNFQWYKNGNPLSNITGRITGATTRTLTVIKLVGNSAGPPATISDEGDYTCRATLGVASEVSGIFRLNVLEAVPQILNKPITALPDATVRAAYDYPLVTSTAQNVLATSYTATGLPPGLSIKPDGHITGVPLIGIAIDTVYRPVIRAINAKGFDEIKPAPTLTLRAIRSVGVYSGPIDRHPLVNDNLGGRIDITTTTLGTFTGTINNGPTLYTITGGVLNTNVSNTFPTGSGVVASIGVSVAFTIDTANNKLSGLTITRAGNSTTGNAWRKVALPPISPSLPLGSPYLDVHNVALTIASSDPALPQGTGYATFTVAATGLLTASGKMPDGTAFTTAGHIGTEGQVMLFAASATASTLVGQLTVTPGVALDYSDYTVTGTCTYSRKASTSRTYPAVIAPTLVNAVGSRYKKPQITQTVMGLPYSAVIPITTQNAKLTFTDADFNGTAPDVNLLLKPNVVAAVVLTPKLRLTTLSVTPSTGFITGLFSCTDPNPLLPTTNISRPNNVFSGLIVRDAQGLSGHGVFTLPNLPRVVGETYLNTKILSGPVTLTP